MERECLFCSSIGSVIAFNQAERIIDFWTVIVVTKTNSPLGDTGKYSVRTLLAGVTTLENRQNRKGKDTT